MPIDFGFEETILQGEVVTSLTVGPPGPLSVVFVESGGTIIDSEAVGGGQIQLGAGAVGIGTIVSANTFGAGLELVAGLASNTQVVGGEAHRQRWPPHRQRPVGGRLHPKRIRCRERRKRRHSRHLHVGDARDLGTWAWPRLAIELHPDFVTNDPKVERSRDVK